MRALSLLVLALLCPLVSRGAVSQIYAMGDSLTASGVYPNHLRSLLGQRFNVNNRGIGGQLVEDMRQRFATDILNYGDANTVIVFGGVNDVTGDRTPAQIQADLQAMYSAAKAAGAKVIAVTMTPFKGSPGWTEARQTVMDTVNAWILLAAVNVDARVNAYDLFEDPANLDHLKPEYDSGDRLHYKTAGARLLAEIIHASTAWEESPQFHSADSNRDGKLSLFELTRVVELYNHHLGTVRTGQYHVQEGSEDGFAVGPSGAGQ